MSHTSEPITIRQLAGVLCIAVLVVSPSTVTASQDRQRVAETVEAPPVAVTVGLDLAAAQQKLDAQQAMCGQGRQVEFLPMPVSRDELENLRQQGKLVAIDPMTGQPVFKHLTDFLPAGWGKIVEGPGKFDSYGNPIVNEVPGLPGWAERDVVALRAAIEDAIARARAAPSPDERAESEWQLGNYLGQAIVRGIDVSDLDGVENQMELPGVADAAIAGMAFYENLKLMRAADAGAEFHPSSYSPEVVAWVEHHGHSLEDVLSVRGPDGAGTKAAPSGCYTGSEFARGMTLLVSPTVIWQASGDDDASADVPTGFLFYFYSCDDPDVNSQVRVSTNGYVSFFQQGGGALNGTNFVNAAITSTVDPDGYIAPNWDDLWVAPAQGSTDTVSYLTEGAVGERVFTVEWYSISKLGGDTADYHYFQVKLFEATGDVELHFLTGWIADTIDSATVGMESFTGLDGDCGPNCDNTNTNSTITANYRFQPVRPPNDLCSNSRISACLAPSDQLVLAGENFGATGIDESSCGANDIHDVWFWYHAPASGNVTFDTTSGGATFDTTLSAFDGCGGAELACNDDFVGLQSSITPGLTGGQDYFVRLAGYNGRQGGYTLTATPSYTPPTGDTCGNAWSDISLGAQTNNNSGCLDDSSCAGSYDTIDEWFEWSPATTGMYSLTTCNPATDFDTSLAAYDACGGSEVACNDDTSGVGLCSTLQLPGRAGNTYYIRIAGYGRAYGVYSLTSTYDSPCPFFDANLVLSNASVTTAEIFGACDTLTAGPNFAIDSPGDVMFEAGNRIVLDNGFSVGSGAVFTATIAPAYLP